MTSAVTFTKEKDPDSTLDYQIDWSDWLGADTIKASEWTAPTGITKVSDSSTTTTATVWLSSGTLGERYKVVNKITTTGGRIENKTIEFIIKEL